MTDTSDPDDPTSEIRGVVVDLDGTVYRGDGVSPVGDVSRLYLLFHAFDKVDRALAQDPIAKEAWDRVDIMGYLFDMDTGGQQLARIRRLIGLNLLLGLATVAIASGGRYL